MCSFWSFYAEKSRIGCVRRRQKKRERILRAKERKKGVTWTMATCKRTPLRPTAMEAAAMTAGPVRNLTAIAKVAMEFPHAMILGCKAMNRPVIHIKSKASGMHIHYYHHIPYCISQSFFWKTFHHHHHHPILLVLPHHPQTHYIKPQHKHGKKCTKYIVRIIKKPRHYHNHTLFSFLCFFSSLACFPLIILIIKMV